MGHGTSYDIRAEAVCKITDQQLLSTLALNSDYCNDIAAAIAVQSLGDQALVKDIALHHKQKRVREAAVKKIDDQSLLVSISRNDSSGDVRQAAVARFTADTTSAEVATAADLERIRFVLKHSERGGQAFRAVVQSMIAANSRDIAAWTAISRADKHRQWHAVFSENGVNGIMAAMWFMTIPDLTHALSPHLFVSTVLGTDLRGCDPGFRAEVIAQLTYGVRNWRSEKNFSAGLDCSKALFSMGADEEVVLDGIRRGEVALSRIGEGANYLTNEDTVEQWNRFKSDVARRYGNEKRYDGLSATGVDVCLQALENLAEEQIITIGGAAGRQFAALVASAGEDGLNALAKLITRLTLCRSYRLMGVLKAAQGLAPTAALIAAVAAVQSASGLIVAMPDSRFPPEIQGPGQIGWTDGTESAIKHLAGQFLDRWGEGGRTLTDC